MKKAFNGLQGLPPVDECPLHPHQAAASKDFGALPLVVRDAFVESVLALKQDIVDFYAKQYPGKFLLFMYSSDLNELRFKGAFESSPEANKRSISLQAFFPGFVPVIVQSCVEAKKVDSGRFIAGNQIRSTLGFHAGSRGYRDL